MTDLFDDLDGIEILASTDQLAGRWADAVRILPGAHAFTIDFVRLDVADSPPTRGVLVSRVAVSPWTTTRLREKLQAHWSEYAARSFPEEIRDGDQEEEQEDGL